MEWLWAILLALISALIYILVRLGSESTGRKKYIYYTCVFFAGIIAFYIYYKLVCSSNLDNDKVQETPNYLCVYYVLVPVAILLGVWMVYGKRPVAQEIIGVIIIAIGIVILIYKPSKKKENSEIKEAKSDVYPLMNLMGLDKRDGL